MLDMRLDRKPWPSPSDGMCEKRKAAGLAMCTVGTSSVWFYSFIAASYLRPPMLAPLSGSTSAVAIETLTEAIVRRFVYILHVLCYNKHVCYVQPASKRSARIHC